MKITQDQIKKFAYKIGFNVIGFSDILIEKEIKQTVTKWIKNDFNGSMKWYNRSLTKRLNPESVLPNIKSIIVVGLIYNSKTRYPGIARFAQVGDYHKIIKLKLILLEKFIKQIFPNSSTLSYVDTGPVLEKYFASKAGLGFIGKNTLLINTRFGSWLNIGVILTDICFKTRKNNIIDKCYKCRKCIDACPTKALIKPYILNANKCISFWTIEKKGKRIPKRIKNKMGTWQYGCDICQEVCPYNKKK